MEGTDEKNNNDNQSVNLIWISILWAIDCSYSTKDNLREKSFKFDKSQCISVSLMVNLISESFDVTKKIRLYNFFGLEIIDESDLSNFHDYLEKYSVIFFTKAQEFFENRNLLKILNIKYKLGEGGFAKVYMAEQKFTSQMFAIKYFRHDYSLIRDINFLYREIEALRRLENKHIIKLYTYCLLDNDKIALILEFASGGNLKGKI